MYTQQGLRQNRNPSVSSVSQSLRQPIKGRLPDSARRFTIQKAVKLHLCPTRPCIPQIKFIHYKKDRPVLPFLAIIITGWVNRVCFNKTTFIKENKDE